MLSLQNARVYGTDAGMTQNWADSMPKPVGETVGCIWAGKENTGGGRHDALQQTNS